MKAQELRIGNWVWNDTQNIPVTVDLKILSEQIYLEPLVAKGTLDKSVLWQPIPLTEEWFLKFGWREKEDYADGIGNYYWFEWGTYETVNVGAGIYGIKDVHLDVIIGSVRYVHQLQNLYFSLTGEELIVK